MITQTDAGRLDLRRVSEGVLQAWQSAFLDTRRARLIFAGFLFTLCLVPILAGPIVQYVYAHDAFIFLDGGWRVLHGQRPQVDFSTNLGPMVFLFTAAGIAIGKHGGLALVIAQALFGVLIAALAYYFSVSRLPGIAGVSLATVLVLLTLAPYNIGEPPWMLTYGMIYNRIGYALLGLILVEAMATARPGRTRIRNELVGGALTGFVCSFLFFLKITYCLVGIALVIMLLPYRQQIRERFVGMAVAGLSFTLLVLAYLRFNVPALIRELRLAAGGKHMPRLSSIGAGMTVVESTLILVALGFLLAWMFSVINHRPMPVSRPWAVFLAAFFGFALLITNHQNGGQPLNAFACILIASELAHYPLSNWKNYQSWLLPPAALLVIALCTPLIALLIPVCVAYALPPLGPLFQWQNNTSEMHLSAPAVSDFRSRDTSPRFDRADNPVFGNYALFVNEGLELLERNSSPSESVVSLEFSNPFSFSLQRNPPKGGTTCLQYGVTFDQQHKLSPDQLFGNADLVMLPKVFSPPLLADAVARYYVKPLLARFHVVARSANWTLFRRTKY
jgi:hypothetical protein